MTAGILSERSTKWFIRRGVVERAGCGRLGLDPTRTFVSYRRALVSRPTSVSVKRRSGIVTPQIRVVEGMGGRFLPVDARVKSAMLGRYIGGIGVLPEEGSIRRAVRDLSPDVRVVPAKVPRTNGNARELAVRWSLSPNKYVGHWVALGPHGLVAAHPRLADLLDELEKRNITGVTTEYIEAPSTSLRIGSG